MRITTVFVVFVLAVVLTAHATSEPNTCCSPPDNCCAPACPWNCPHASKPAAEQGDCCLSGCCSRLCPWNCPHASKPAAEQGDCCFSGCCSPLCPWNCPPEPKQAVCLDVLNNTTPNLKSFAGDVAHAVHSLTVGDLRKFHPYVTVNNTIPTVNMDLRAPDAVLPFAPESEKSPFMTDAMKALDAILSHWDNPNYDVRGFSIVERIVHIFHMREGWAMIRSLYEEIKNGKRPGKAECDCIRDVNANGVMKALRYIALAVREPGLVYGSPYKASYYVQYNFRSHSIDDQSTTIKQDDLLKSEQDAMPELKDEASWSKWKSLIAGMDMASHYNAALFLYCNLNSM